MLQPELKLSLLSEKQNYRFHAMVKPSGSRCNIDCDYCFYLHKQELLQHTKHSNMEDSVLEQHVRQYIEAQTGDEVIFSWQGGEPTLMGIPFFERVVALQKNMPNPVNELAMTYKPTVSHWINTGCSFCKRISSMWAYRLMARGNCMMPFVKRAVVNPLLIRSWPQPNYCVTPRFPLLRSVQ